MKKTWFTILFLCVLCLFCIGCGDDSARLDHMEQRLASLEETMNRAPWEASESGAQKALTERMEALEQAISAFEAAPSAAAVSEEAEGADGVGGAAAHLALEGCEGSLSYDEADGWIAELNYDRLAETYTINQLEEGYMEYQFGIQFTLDGTDYEISTSYFKSGNPEKKTIPVTGMQHDLWEISGSSMSTLSGSHVKLTVDGSTLHWTFQKPKPVDFSTLEITGIVITENGSSMPLA